MYIRPKRETTAAEKWVMAARPKTLVAAIVPVLLGAAYASHTGFSDMPTLLMILASALCIQIGTNLANDYADFKKGADTKDRLGPTRVTAAGLLKPDKVKRGAFTVFALAVVFGAPLIVRGGWPILLIGALSILFGWMYTGGPFPLGYNGLGEVFVFLFFGLAAVMGTSYLFIFKWTVEAVVLGVAPGLFASALLTINNVRDIETDRASGKKTLAARFGRTFGRIEYAFCMLVPFVIPVIFYLQFGFTKWALFPLLAIILIIRPLMLAFTKTDGASMNRALEGTARAQLFFGVLFAIGLLV